MKTLYKVVAFTLVAFLFESTLIYADQTSSFNRILLASAEKLPDNEGIVVSTLDTAGYTYMELENGSKRFWIAAPTTKVKIGDHIRFAESMTMHNFTSKTLNRTFNRLVFVTSTQVKVAQ
ncbi:NrfJ [Nitrosomonas sp.]|uniref:NrfJ n=1 Tax=Nitrosomonas sp. TaxID=42353 RepID=UPI00260D0261|nr:NrfJ [Nitrosomonas sp.]